VIKPPNILIVDDEEPTLFAMTEYFTYHGFVVDRSRDLPEAEALLAVTPYAAIITDLRLAGTDGRQGLDIIAAARKRWPGIRVILLTAYGSPQVEAEARRLGVDAFLHKPRPLPELEQTLWGLLASSPGNCQV
jgi:two-component system, response regulator FlrC